MAGNLGADGVQEAARELEAGLKDKRDGDEALIERFQAELRPLVDSISEAGIGTESEQASQPGHGSLSRDQALEKIDELLAHLKHRKPKPAKETQEYLQDFKWTSAQRADLHEVARALGKYRFADARPIVEKLRVSLQGTDSSA